VPIYSHCCLLCESLPGVASVVIGCLWSAVGGPLEDGSGSVSSGSICPRSSVGRVGNLAGCVGSSSSTGAVSFFLIAVIRRGCLASFCIGWLLQATRSPRVI
jgi:hypothetical protein